MEADAGALRLSPVGDGVLELVIDRPARANAFTTAMWERLGALVEQARQAGARALVLRSADRRIFASGVDFDELVAMLDDPALRRRHWRAMTGATATLAAAPFVTIAEIAGAAAGAGLSILLACDLRLAASSARFVLPPARLGLVYPRADLGRLVRTVGEAAARELLFQAAPRDAAWAARWGLVHELHPDAEALRAAVAGAAARAAALAPSAVAALKRTLAADKESAGSVAGTEDEEARFVAAFDDADVRARILAARRR